MLFNQIVRLPDEDSGLSLSIARFYNGLVDAKKEDNNKLFRREMIVITNQENGSKILRYVMGSASLSIKKMAIAIDYDGVDALGITDQNKCSIKVHKASKIEIIKWFYGHADMSIQLSTRLGLLGALLGILGFAIGIASLV
jgi:hypothetical protein